MGAARQYEDARPEEIGPAVDALLDEAVAAFAQTAATELAPADRVSLVVGCAGCGRRRRLGLVLELDAVGPGDLDAFVAETEALARGRSPHVEGDVAAALRACACRGPAHLRRVECALRLRAMSGSGAVLAARSDGHATALFRIPLDGAPVPLVGQGPAALQTSFGRGLGWLDGEVVETGARELEPGVWLVLGARCEVHARVGQLPPSLVVAIDGESLVGRRLRLPGSGDVAALAVSRATIEGALARAAAKGGASFREGRLQVGALSLAPSPEAVALEMASRGWLLADAAAREARAVIRAIEQAAAVLEAVASLHPSVRFEVDGGLVGVAHPDGRRGPARELAMIAALDPAAPTFARDAAFVADARAPWADPTRVCRCGAAAWALRRLAPALDEEPRHIVGRHPEAGLVELLLVACERHAEAPLAGDLDPELLGDALAVAQPRLRLDYRVLEDERGRLAIVARGRDVVSVGLDDGLTRGLCAIDPRAEALARAPRLLARPFGDDALVLADPAFAALDEADALAARAAGLAPGAAPLATFVRVPSAATPRGRFALATPRLEIAR